MKRGERTMLFIALVLIVVGIALATSAAASVGFDMPKVLSDEYRDVERRIDTTYGELDGIKIDAVDGDVRFDVAEGNEILVVCSERRGVTHEVSLRGGVLEIKRVDERKWYERIAVMDFTFLRDGGITVFLPPCSLQNIEIKTVSGDVELPDGIVTDELHVKTTSGDIDAVSVKCWRAELLSTSGEVMCEYMTAGELSAETTSGDVTVTASSAELSLTAKTVSGDVELYGVNKDKGAGASAKFNITTTSGDVRLSASNAGDIKIKTVSGDVRCDSMRPMDYVTSTVSGDVHIDAAISMGTSPCSIKTTSGDITVEGE